MAPAVTAVSVRLPRNPKMTIIPFGVHIFAKSFYFMLQKKRAIN